MLETLKLYEWKKVKIGGYLEAIGYISNMFQHSTLGEQVELTKVIYMIDGEPQLKKPTHGLYSPEKLLPASLEMEMLQDRSQLVDLALMTRDENWFYQLIGGRT